MVSRLLQYLGRHCNSDWCNPFKLKAGLAKVAQGVGNGLKELGKRLGEILPGMIGAIASFISRTAGEVIGFLAKNAWLLIVGLVVFAVEQFKNKKK